MLSQGFTVLSQYRQLNGLSVIYSFHRTMTLPAISANLDTPTPLKAQPWTLVKLKQSRFYSLLFIVSRSSSGLAHIAFYNDMRGLQWSKFRPPSSPAQQSDKSPSFLKNPLFRTERGLIKNSFWKYWRQASVS